MNIFRQVILIAALGIFATSCGDINTNTTEVKQELSRGWTGSRVVIRSALSCNNVPKQVQFVDSRLFDGTTFYEYIQNTTGADNDLTGNWGPLQTPPPGSLAQTMYCSAASNASIGVQMLPHSVFLGPTFYWNNQTMNCGLITFWGNGVKTTARFTSNPGDWIAFMGASPFSQYTFRGNRDDSVGSCGTFTVSVNP